MVVPEETPYPRAQTSSLITDLSPELVPKLQQHLGRKLSLRGICRCPQLLTRILSAHGRGQLPGHGLSRSRLQALTWPCVPWPWTCSAWSQPSGPQGPCLLDPQAKELLGSEAAADQCIAKRKAGGTWNFKVACGATWGGEVSRDALASWSGQVFGVSGLAEGGRLPGKMALLC